MKIAKAKTCISALAAAAIVLSGGAVYMVSTDGGSPVVSAYTSAINAQDPATAPDGYVVTIPDAQLKTALNDIIARVMNAERKRQGLPEDVVRTPDQQITAGDMKLPVNMYGPLGLNNKNITNLEGLQFLVNATYLVISGNAITDVSPLRDLPKLTRLEISNTGIANAELTKLVAIPKLTRLAISRNPNVTDISALAARTDWTELNLGGLKIDSVAHLAGMTKLQYLYIDALNATKKIDLTPIASLPELLALNVGHQAVGLTDDDVRVLKDAPKLAALNISGNDIRDLQKVFADGFTGLQAGRSTFTDQKHAVVSLAAGQQTFDNPLKRPDGTIVPIVETSTVKNNGDKIVITGLNNKGSLRVSWNTTFTTGALVDTRFTGFMTVEYDLSDAIAPTFSPDQPAKIVARKGQPIILDDVTAVDNPGGSGISPAGVTNNATAINLNPTNPAAGNYTLRYSATDNTNNTATVDREIEITDADALQAKVDSVTDDSLEGYTDDTKQAVTTAKQHAEAVIAATTSTQEQIDRALRDLEGALSGLRATRRLIEQAIAQHDQAPEYVKQDPAVATALQQANDVYHLPAPGPTPAQVKQAADNLIKAIEDAKRAEANAETQRQADALQAVTQAATVKTPAQMDAAQVKIDAVKDAAKKQELQAALDAVRAAYATKKDQLRRLIEQANEPAVLDGMTIDTANDVKAERKDTKERVYDNNGIDQASIEDAIQHLQAALDNLRADKKPLVDAEATYAAQPNDIKNDPAVMAALRKVQDTGAMANPSVRQVKDDAQALEDAIAAAVRARQQQSEVEKSEPS